MCMSSSPHILLTFYSAYNKQENPSTVASFEMAKFQTTRDILHTTRNMQIYYVWNVIYLYIATAVAQKFIEFVTYKTIPMSVQAALSVHGDDEQTMREKEHYRMEQLRERERVTMKNEEESMKDASRQAGEPFTTN